MSLPRRSRYEKWKNKRKYGEPLSRGAINKVSWLMPQLRRDATSLGIQNMTVGIYPKSGEDWAAMIDPIDFQIRNDGVVTVPNGMTYSYEMLDALTKEELRALAWHEFGHYIYSYFFPKSDKLYLKDKDHYYIQELFCDEFAYRRFGDVYINTSRKMDKLGGLRKGESSPMTKDLLKARAYAKKHGRNEYWLERAKKKGIKPEYEPKKSQVIGVRQRKAVIVDMYSE